MWCNGILYPGKRSDALKEYLHLYTSPLQNVDEGTGNSNPVADAIEKTKAPHLFSLDENPLHDIEYTLEELPGEHSSLFPESATLNIWTVRREDLQYLRPEFVALSFTRRVIFYRLYDLGLTRTLLAIKLENRQTELCSLENRATKIGGKSSGEDFVPSDILHAKYQRMYGKTPVVLFQTSRLTLRGSSSKTQIHRTDTFHLATKARSHSYSHSNKCVHCWSNASAFLARRCVL